MCGIAGFRGGPTDPAIAAGRLLSHLGNRGPDGGWIESHQGWNLIQTRLAVIDLSPNVRYPMRDEHDRLRVLFNGEVYNHQDLRTDLQRRGHRFATACDAEVVVHGWEEWGDALFARLNGMWAIAIVDREGELVLARDRLGIKPLARTQNGPSAFASEVTALVTSGLVRPAIDIHAVEEYLAFHYVPAPRTGIQGVVDVKPGSLVRIDRDGRAIEKRWAPVPFVAPRSTQPSVSIAEVEAAVEIALGRQVQADVDVGVFLSGGLDSTLVLHYAQEAGARPKAFTVGFSGHGEYDEAPRAALVARHYGAEHVIEPFSPDLPTTLDELALAYDRPFADPSAIATLSLARLARHHVTVALSGTGGDDLFAGYVRHRSYRLDPFLSALPRPLLQRIACMDPRRGAEHEHARSRTRSYAVRLARLALVESEQRYLRLVGTSTGGEALAALSWKPDLDSARRRVSERLGFNMEGATSALDAIQSFELRSYLPGDLLFKEDRATMRHGLEGRVPLLDDELVAVAERTPDNERAGWRTGKRLLRRLAHARLPPELLNNRKHGFAIPLGAYFAGPWHDSVRDWLRDGRSELVDSGALARAVGDSAMTPLDLWALLALIAWERRLFTP